METISFQPDLRPELPLIDGPKEYRDQRALFLRLDDLLIQTGLEREFLTSSLAHRRIKLSECSAAQARAMNAEDFPPRNSKARTSAEISENACFSQNQEN